MVKQPKYSERVDVKIVRADPDGTWIIQTSWSSGSNQARHKYQQIDGSAGFELDEAAAWWIAGEVAGIVKGRLF